MADAGRKPTINPDEPFFIFDSRGEWHATLLNNCLWDARGEYIGFVRGAEYDVYTAYGQWIGNLAPDGRIIRKRTKDQRAILKIKKLPPPRPANLPPKAPLPRMSGDLGYHYIDVLEWEPNVFDHVPDLKTDLQ
jgi:hypothetical protein